MIFVNHNCRVTNKGGALLFAEQPFESIYKYFREIGGSHNQPVIRQNGHNMIVTIETKINGRVEKFTLRNISTSADKTGRVWTIDIPGSIYGLARSKELKFKVKE